MKSKYDNHDLGNIISHDLSMRKTPLCKIDLQPLRGK